MPAWSFSFFLDFSSSGPFAPEPAPSLTWAEATILIWSPARVADSVISASFVVSRILSMIGRNSSYLCSDAAMPPPPPASSLPLKNVEGVPRIADP